MKARKLLDKAIAKSIRNYNRIDAILYPHAKEKNITAAQYLAIELAESKHLLNEIEKLHEILLRKLSTRN